jgi:PIN domain nuclease of toxin-antitoxin system
VKKRARAHDAGAPALPSSLLVDTQLLLWAAFEPDRLPPRARALLASRAHVLCFSLASIWEVALKTSLGREDFRVDAALLHKALVTEGWVEVPIAPPHLFRVGTLPWVHRDPFDRLLVAQALEEGHALLTADASLVGYGPFVHPV